MNTGRWRDGDKTADLRAAHHQLHRNPRAEGKPTDPTVFSTGVDGLHPIECGSSIAQFALTVIETSLGSADTAKIKSQN